MLYLEYNGGIFCPGGFCPRGILSGGFVLGDFVLEPKPTMKPRCGINSVCHGWSFD